MWISKKKFVAMKAELAIANAENRNLSDKNQTLDGKYQSALRRERAWTDKYYNNSAELAVVKYQLEQAQKWILQRDQKTGRFVKRSNG